MPKIEKETFIQAPLDVVWDIAQDVEKLPEIMPDLDKVQVLERESPSDVTTRVVTEWQGRIKQFNRKMEWTEEDIWNEENHTCHFWQIRGDFTDYRGEYRFATENNGTRVHLQIEYTFDIPLIGALMKNVIQKLMQDNCEGMLRSLKEEGERRASA